MALFAALVISFSSYKAVKAEHISLPKKREDELSQIKQNTPLILKHVKELFGNTATADFAAHRSHSSHRSHASHSSHYSSRHSSHASHSSHYSAAHTSHFSSVYVPSNKQDASSTATSSKSGKTWDSNSSTISIHSSEERASRDTYFTLGSSKDDVAIIQGTPKAIIGNTWYYEGSTITFSDDKVVGYDNSTGKLKIKINL